MISGVKPQQSEQRAETTASSPGDAKLGIADYLRVRQRSEAICAPLEIEDYGVQPMADASPPKWHLAHTTWFFETFLIKPHQPSAKPFHPAFEHLFNSYYNGVGEPFSRAKRGNLSRPTVAEIAAYRSYVDETVSELLAADKPPALQQSLLDTLALGLHHEQQHQELLLTDIKFNFGHNPLYPALIATSEIDSMAQPARGPSCENFQSSGASLEQDFTLFEPGLVDIGAQQGFCFDNELPRHPVYLTPFGLAKSLVTNEAYQAFIDDDGYSRPELWLSEAWAELQQHSRRHPLYWCWQDGQWFEYRLDGYHPLVANAPVVHVSGYEAAAFAAWSDARLPTEFEWEYAASKESNTSGNFADSGHLHPQSQHQDHSQMFGDVWEWTSSSYGPYPGYEPLLGVLGEYNGKFMSSQWVLRGGSCATPQDHIRRSYRNFFYPKDAWQFSGIRLARNP